MPAPPDHVSDANGRPADYPFTSWASSLEAAIRKLSGRPRHCAINAYRWLRQSWQIAPIAPEMAYFQAITAEEEAATALMIALKQRKYPGSDKLQPRNHNHKAGMWPLLIAVNATLARTGFPTPKIRLRVENTPPRFDVLFSAEALGLPGTLTAELDEPFNGLVQSISGHFDRALQALAEAEGAASIMELVEKEANLRNLLLYASDGGLTVVQHVDDALVERGRRVAVLLTLVVAILQTRMVQTFAAQVLGTYLQILPRLAFNEVDYAAMLPELSDTVLTVVKHGDQTHASLQVPITLDLTFGEINNADPP